MSCERCTVDLKTSEIHALEKANVSYRQCDGCLIKCCEKKCEWRGIAEDFVFDFCPNHRALEWNEDTYGCFICIECRKYYRPSNTVTYDDWKCQVCTNSRSQSCSKRTTHEE